MTFFRNVLDAYITTTIFEAICKINVCKHFLVKPINLWWRNSLVPPSILFLKTRNGPKFNNQLEKWRERNILVLNKLMILNLQIIETHTRVLNRTSFYSNLHNPNLIPKSWSIIYNLLTVVGWWPLKYYVRLSVK